MACFRSPHYLTLEPLILTVVQREAELMGTGRFLLFRGVRGHDTDDSSEPLPSTGGSRPYSISYGAALFSGILHDSSAVPYSAMLPFDCAAAAGALQPPGVRAVGHYLELGPGAGPWEDYFAVPRIPVLARLAGLGEVYHPRSKVAVEDPAVPVGGILNCSGRHLPECLRTTADVARGLREYVRRQQTELPTSVARGPWAEREGGVAGPRTDPGPPAVEGHRPLLDPPPAGDCPCAGDVAAAAAGTGPGAGPATTPPHTERGHPHPRPDPAHCGPPPGRGAPRPPAASRPAPPPTDPAAGGPLRCGGDHTRAWRALQGLEGPLWRYVVHRCRWRLKRFLRHWVPQGGLGCCLPLSTTEGAPDPPPASTPAAPLPPSAACGTAVGPDPGPYPAPPSGATRRPAAAQLADAVAALSDPELTALCTCLLAHRPPALRYAFAEALVQAWLLDEGAPLDSDSPDTGPSAPPPLRPPRDLGPTRPADVSALGCPASPGLSGCVTAFLTSAPASAGASHWRRAAISRLPQPPQPPAPGLFGRADLDSIARASPNWTGPALGSLESAADSGRRDVLRPSDTRPGAIALATLNVHGRLPDCVPTILSLCADVLALQEVYAGTLPGAAASAGYAYFAFVGCTAASEFGNALLCRYPIRAVRRAFLTGDRGVLHVAIAVGRDGARLEVVVTHLDHVAEARRLTQVRELRAWLEAEGIAARPHVLTGDLNALSAGNLRSNAEGDRGAPTEPAPSSTAAVQAQAMHSDRLPDPISAPANDPGGRSAAASSLNPQSQSLRTPVPVSEPALHTPNPADPYTARGVDGSPRTVSGPCQAFPTAASDGTRARCVDTWERPRVDVLEYLLRGCGYRDVFVAPCPPTCWAGTCVDYVLLSDAFGRWGAVQGCGVTECPASDHNAVWAHLLHLQR